MNSSKVAKSSNSYLPNLVLDEWTNAMASFHKHFHELLAVLNQPVRKRKPKEAALSYIGQCPVSQLLHLHKMMQDELIRLSQDIHPVRELSESAIRKHYNTLSHHTSVLNQLNQRAQCVLYVANQPGS